jgi:serine-threonine kinase receptor-associated protein
MVFTFSTSSLSDRWWDLRTRTLTKCLTFPGPIASMELSPQTHRLVVTSGKSVAFIPALPNGSATHSLTLPYPPSSASIHPLLQDRFVTGSLGDEWVRVHGMDGEEREVLKGHHGPVHCVEFSPDGEMYASGSGTCGYFFFRCLPLTAHDSIPRSIPRPAEDGKCF